MGNGADLSTNRSSPVVDFTSADHASIKADIESYAQSKYAIWTDFNSTQPAVMFSDITAYAGDLLTYQLNAYVRELYAATVMRRQNLLAIGKPFQYEPNGAEAATVTERFTLDPLGIYPFTLLRSSTQVSNETSGDDQVIFQPLADIVVSAYGVGYIDVDMAEGERFESTLIGVSSNSPSQRWQFPQQNVIKDSVIITVGGVTWALISNWTGTQSTDRVFKIIQTDDGNTYAIFGDGTNGSIPPNNSEIRATFRVGGGRRGNLNSGTITRKVSVPAQVLSVTNLDRSSGGDNAMGMKAAREGIPSTISTLKRAVTEDDHEKLSLQVGGVAKARYAPGLPSGSNRIRGWIAPSGGGAPTTTLKSNVSAYMRPKKMVGRRISLYSPLYKTMRFCVLLHVNENYRAAEVEQVVRAGLLNTNGTGLLDFAQLDFGAIYRTADGNTELLLGQTRLQAYFDGLRTSGLDRAEILQLDILPEARVRDSGNTGDGEVTNITTTGRQRRREFSIELVSAAQYRVYERIIGRVFDLTDNTLTDEEKDFSLEGVTSFSGYSLVPNRNTSSVVTVASATDQKLQILGTGGASLFTLTEVGDEYYLFNPTGTLLDVGSEFTSSDGNVKFTLVDGGTPFIAGDAFSLDVFPQISDLRLRSDEYPQLVEDNFITRPSGGSKV